MVTQSDVREFGKVIDGRRILIPPINETTLGISAERRHQPFNYGMILSNFTKMENGTLLHGESHCLGRI